ncbi:MAG: hypothetical protein CMN73_07750 [Sphingomonas sp.]|nr:hypothetical protein [Sphingomonas sp.]|tara:strand:- start:131 stop:367 length:237 start_codon:yes stop_codon:yes gene_type:complete
MHTETRNLVIALIRALSDVWLLLLGQFLALLLAFSAIGFERASFVIQFSALALVAAAALQIIVARPLWLIPKLRGNRG